jgi:formylmethanofuran dehydrogenase subunit E
MTLAGLAALSETKAHDEELVAIVENDACGVDAVQVLTGCTFGRGNLIFHDYGKSAYTFFSRRTGAGVRVVWKEPQATDDIPDDRQARVEWILAAPESDMVAIQSVQIAMPPRARIHESLHCDVCGERVMATRIHRVGGRNLCIPCRDKLSD